ncbi:MAG: ABC transporter ATP-binding protein [Clostridia bacterium]|nr:ABC transporter ATP-binding protein [Clostridia bacterium]
MIEVKNVSKKYGDFYAIRNINFNIKDGEIVGFLGRNGAGKTTTMNMLTGFIEPTCGQIIVNGYDVDIKPKKVKGLIGYMPEGVPLYSDLTVKEFVSYMADLKLVPHKKKKEAVEKAIMQTGLDKVRNRLTRNLSRGFKQRVSMAGALVGDPEILILDEPTVGLDPKQVKEIRELIKSFKKNHTVILSSHILSEVSQICEKVIIIDKGEIIAIDTPENLEKNTETHLVFTINIEDAENQFEKLFKNDDSIKELKLIKENDDQTKVYQIELKDNITDDTEFRKKFAIRCAENNILNLGMKKEENSLEDAFIKLIEDRPEYSHEEIKKMQYQKELDDLRKEIDEKKELKEQKKEQREKLKQEKKEEKENSKNENENSEKEISKEKKDLQNKNNKDNSKGGNK